MQQEAWLTTEAAQRTCCLSLDAIIPREDPTHTGTDVQALRCLAISIRREGLREPIAVEGLGNGQYRLLDGNKRYYALRMLGLSHVEANIVRRPVAERSAGELIDAILAGKMHYIEEAQALKRLVCAFGMRAERLAGLMDADTAEVERKLTLMNLEEQLQCYLTEHKLPEAYAYQLLRLPSGDMRMQVARQAAENNLCIRDVELIIRRMMTRLPAQQGTTITLMRDYRLYVNAIRDLVGQMQTAGIAAEMTEEREGGALQVNITIPVRRAQRHQVLGKTEGQA